MKQILLMILMAAILVPGAALAGGIQVIFPDEHARLEVGKTYTIRWNIPDPAKDVLNDQEYRTGIGIQGPLGLRYIGDKGQYGDLVEMPAYFLSYSTHDRQCGTHSICREWTLKPEQLRGQRGLYRLYVETTSRKSSIDSNSSSGVRVMTMSCSTFGKILSSPFW